MKLQKLKWKPTFLRMLPMLLIFKLSIESPSLLRNSWGNFSFEGVTFIFAIANLSILVPSLSDQSIKYQRVSVWAHAVEQLQCQFLQVAASVWQGSQTISFVSTFLWGAVSVISTCLTHCAVNSWPCFNMPLEPAAVGLMPQCQFIAKKFYFLLLHSLL